MNHFFALASAATTDLQWRYQSFTRQVTNSTNNISQSSKLQVSNYPKRTKAMVWDSPQQNSKFPTNNKNCNSKQKKTKHMSALSFTTFTPDNPLTEMQPRRPNKRLKKKKRCSKTSTLESGVGKGTIRQPCHINLVQWSLTQPWSNSSPESLSPPLPRFLLGRAQPPSHAPLWSWNTRSHIINTFVSDPSPPPPPPPQKVLSYRHLDKENTINQIEIEKWASE